MYSIRLNHQNNTIKVVNRPQNIRLSHTGKTGPIGPRGPIGISVPIGGLTGQGLYKVSDSNYDFEWRTPPAAILTSVHGRIGDVVGELGDYSASQITFSPDSLLTEENVQDALAHASTLISDLTTAFTGHLHVSTDITDFDAAADARIGAANFTDLADVVISSVDNGEIVIRHDGQWKNGQLQWGMIGGTLASQTDLTSYVTGLVDTKEDTIAAGTTAQYWRGDKTWQTLDKTAVGLPNVDNTTDANKPVSTATQTALNLKANLASPALTGTPTAPTAASLTNTTQIATTAYVRTEISNLVASAPGTLDTLNELAAALGNDPNFATTLTTNLAGKVAKAGDSMTGNLTFDSSTLLRTGDSLWTIATKRTTSTLYGIALTSQNASAADTARFIIGTGANNTDTVFANTSAVYFTNGSESSANRTITISPVNGTIAPSTAGTGSIGVSGAYWNNLYATRHYFNSTAFLDGGTAGRITMTSGQMWLTKASTNISAANPVIIQRAATTDGQAITMGNGITVDYHMGRLANSDDLVFGVDGGGGFGERVRFSTGGTITASSDITATGKLQATASSGSKFGRSTNISDETVILARTTGEGDPTLPGGSVAVFQNNSASGFSGSNVHIAGTAGSFSLYFGDKDNSQIGYLRYDNTSDQFGFNRLVNFTGGAISSSTLTINTTGVPLIMRDTGTAVNAGGLTRFATSAGTVRLDYNTAAAGDFSTYASIFTANAQTGAITFGSSANPGVTVGPTGGGYIKLGDGTMSKVTGNFFSFHGNGIQGINNLVIGQDSANVARRLLITGSISSASWGTGGPLSEIADMTVTDSSAAGTRTTGVASSFGRPTFAATNAATTITDAATVYIKNAPVAGTNMAITNAYSLWIDDGMSRIDGVLHMNADIAMNGGARLNLTGGTNNGLEYMLAPSGSGVIYMAARNNIVYMADNDGNGGTGHVWKVGNNSQNATSGAVMYLDTTGLGLGTQAPTHSITLASAATGMTLYNTSDQTTNYERGRLFWTSNTLTLQTEAAGTGTVRNMRVKAAQSLYLEGNASNVELQATGTGINIYRNNTGLNLARITSTGLTSSSANQYGLAIDPTISQSGTASYTALLINPTENTTGSGSKVLIEAQVGGSSRFTLLNTGAASFVGAVTVPDDAYAPTWDGNNTVPTKNAIYDKLASLSTADITNFAAAVTAHTDVAANTAARHTHSNMSVLDATTASYTTAEQTKLSGIQAGAQVNEVGQADIDAAIAALVDASPGTLNTLNELAAALGDDPNFATTITNQIAGKADAVHTHVISDVTGLQTALDEKVAGPSGGSTDNNIVRWDGATGRLVQNSGADLNDNGRLTLTPSSNSEALNITNSGTGVSMRVTNSGTGIMAVYDSSATNAAGVLIRNQSAVRNATGTGSLLAVQNMESTGSGDTLHVSQNANGKGIQIDHNNTNVSFDIDKDVTNKNSPNESIRVVHTSVVDDAATYSKTGAVISVTSNVIKTSGNITDSAQIMSLTQSHDASTGSVLNISNVGTGNAVAISSQNGSSLDITSVTTDKRVISINNTGAQTTVDAMVRMKQSNASTTVPVMELETDATTGGGLLIDNNGAGLSLNIDQDASSSSTIIGASIDVDNTGTGGTVGLNIPGVSTAGAAATAIGLRVQPTTGVSGSTVIGVQIQAPSGGTNNRALDLSDTGGTAAGGITFGNDTTLYRSAADTLQTDDAFKISNTTASPGLYVVQGANTTTSLVNGGAFAIDNTSNNYYAATIYSNNGANQATSLFRIRADNGAYDQPVLYVSSEVSGSVNDAHAIAGVLTGAISSNYTGAVMAHVSNAAASAHAFYAGHNGTSGSAFRTWIASSGAVHGLNVLHDNSSATGSSIVASHSGGSFSSGGMVALSHSNTGVTQYVRRTVTNKNDTNTGKGYDLVAASTVNDGATYAKSGSVFSITSSVTETSGTITDSAQVLDINQTHADATGDTVSVDNDGTGIGIRVNQNGILGANKSGIDVRSTAAQTTGSAIALFTASNASTTIPVAVISNSGTGYSLQLTSTAGTANSGITFGTDTNIYRSAANMLKTDDSFTVAGDMFSDGSFTLANAKSITTKSPTGVTVPLIKSNGGIGDIHFFNDITTDSVANIYFAYNTSRPVQFGSGATKPASLSFDVDTVGTVSFKHAGDEKIIVAGNGVGMKASPTHTLTLGSAGTGLAIYNTSDVVTNYERGRLYWTGNTLNLTTDNGGTGTVRNLVVGSGAVVATFNATGTNKITLGYSTTTTSDGVNVTGTMTGNSAIVQTGLKVTPTINQSSTAGYTGLLVNVTETATGSGAKTLLDLQVGSSSKLSVDNTGAATFAGDVTVPDEAYGAGWNGSLEVPTKNAVYDKIEALVVGGGGDGVGITRVISTVTTTITAGATALTDYVYFISTGDLTLPTAVSNTNAYTIKNISATNKTISTTSSQTIEGGTLILGPSESVTLYSDGANWQIT